MAIGSANAKTASDATEMVKNHSSRFMPRDYISTLTWTLLWVRAGIYKTARPRSAGAEAANGGRHVVKVEMRDDRPSTGLQSGRGNRRPTGRGKSLRGKRFFAL
jgi:hypothetical protein